MAEEKETLSGTQKPEDAQIDEQNKKRESETLSDQIVDGYEHYDFPVVPVEKLKEFIREVRNSWHGLRSRDNGQQKVIDVFNKNITKLAGEKLK